MYRWVDRPVEDHERALKGVEDEQDHPEDVIVWIFAAFIGGLFTLALVIL